MLKKDSIVTHDNQTGDKFYLIREGECEIIKHLPIDGYN